MDTVYPTEYQVEHDASQLWQTLDVALKQILRDFPGQYSAGLATQRSSIVCWNKNTGEPLTPVISWQDRRAHETMALFLDQRDYIHHKTGLFPSPHYGASKIRWCLDHIPAVQQADAENNLVCGPLASYLMYRLTRQSTCKADPANASRTLLWNLNSQSWDDDLLALFKIKPHLLPSCSDSQQTFGTYSDGQSEIVFNVMTGDQSAVLYGNGALATDCLYINIGTGAFIQRHFETRIQHPDLLTSIVHQYKNSITSVLEGTVNGAASALAWAKKNYHITYDHEQLDDLLFATKNPAIFLNTVSGLGSPYWIADLPPKLLQNNHNASIITGIVNSILFLIQTNIACMNQSIPEPEKIILSGGLSQLDYIAQRLADLSGITVYQSKETELTTKGILYLLGCELPKQSFKCFSPTDNQSIQQDYVHWKKALLAYIR